MPRIDVYLENLDRHQARGLLLVSDQPVRLLYDGGERLLRKSCTAEEILTLAQEVMGANDRRRFVVLDQVQFPYRVEALGALSISLERTPTEVRCLVTRSPGSREPID